MAAILHVHLTDVSTNDAGQYVVPTQASLAAITVDGAAHNHGDADLTVSGFTKGSLVNCTVSILTFPLGTFPPGDVGDFELMVTPSAYGDFSFRITITSNDAGSSMVLDFVGVAQVLDADIGWTPLNRRLEWTAPNRRLEFTAT